jgi:8-oxo-dGTP pyrophosphatase MutT (NUDIX family)
MTILYSKEDAAYLPRPNIIQFIQDDTISPLDLTKTSFMVPILWDGSVVMAQNRRRGLEFPGGHIEPLESPTAAAHRETIEETGYWVNHIKALGYLLMQSSGVAPEGYAYPHPIGYQQFFVGRPMSHVPYVENDECLSPVVLSREEAKLRLDPHRFIIYDAARRLLNRE